MKNLNQDFVQKEGAFLYQHKNWTPHTSHIGESYSTPENEILYKNTDKKRVEKNTEEDLKNLKTQTDQPNLPPFMRKRINIPFQKSPMDRLLEDPGSEMPQKKKESVEVFNKDFKRVVDYIEKNGFVVTERGVPCDHQYTFFDKNGNRHAMITIKRDENGNPSMDGSVEQVSVWAYRDGIIDDDHFFSYEIDSQGIKPFYEVSPKEQEDINSGYQSFLKKVKSK